MVVAALSSWHDEHAIASAASDEVAALPEHAFTECYSVLTRLPSGLGVTAESAVGLLARRFPKPPLTVLNRDRTEILERLAAAGVSGGATYDGLVGLEAATHGETLLTLDRRAEVTYRRLGVRYELIV